MATRGRKKGSTSYVELTYEELGQYVGNLGVVKVSKAWLETLGWNANIEVVDGDENSEEEKHSASVLSTSPNRELSDESGEEKVVVVREKLV